MKEYNHKDIESKWQKYWAENQINLTKNEFDKPKYYVLDMFPYPSGQGLHVGHPKGYIATDIISRYKKLKGFNVLHPMGWDAFGLPAENYALKNKTHPNKTTSENVVKFKKQLEIIGLDYDWSREINTTDPKYYKWTQWIFLKLYEKGLAYESNEPINWCPSCKTGLAQEDLEDGKCERCGSVVEKRPIRQWVLKIRDYADRLLADLKDLDWPESIKESQKNWIGRSEGTELSFDILVNGQKIADKLDVFTTRVDTIFGVTYAVLAPEHPLVQKLAIQNRDEVDAYLQEIKSKSEIERTAEGKEKTGVELKGVKIVNPVNQREVPLWIADYVLAQYGTGAVMAVPAHDSRDLEFATKFNLEIKKVIETNNADQTIDGVLINSGEFDGLESKEAREKITAKFGQKKVTYKLRDWVFSRQRYWGEPIPLVHCEKCGVVPVPESELPVVLPEVESYEPTGTGESPLAGIHEWVNTTCPGCGGPAKRETNTMPQWAGSSWYYLRFMDPNNDEQIFDKEIEKYWAPVDFYVGGAEHATRHLIYARFWHKVLFDLGVVSTAEPFKKLQSVGLIMAADGRKMSKRWNNVVNPNDIVDQFGADTLRIFEMFLGPFEKSANWNTESIIGPRRFLERVWNLQSRIVVDLEDSHELKIKLNQAIKKVGNDIENINFNTAISEMMILINFLETQKEISKESYLKLIQILSPFAPHLAEEIWQSQNASISVFKSTWPSYDESLTKDEKQIIPIQINGKVRAKIEVDADMAEDEITQKALENKDILKWIDQKEVKKVIYIKGKILSIVI